MFLVVPKGQSLRAVAERLGVAVEELQRHTAVKDVDAPAAIEHRLEVPDGFLRSTRDKRELTDAVTSASGKRGGMNMWLALDIEQKRTRAAGGMKKGPMRDSDTEALGEAMNAYLRFEAASNDLAADLFNQLTVTTDIEVRARAFAGMACAQAQRNLIYGQAPERCRPPALSSAKAAQLANPKLADGHLAMALALQIQAVPSDIIEAREELERAVGFEPTSVTCLTERARLELRVGDLAAARLASDAALAVSADFALALEVRAHLRLHAGDRVGAAADLRRATTSTPTYADAWAMLATLVKGTEHAVAIENARAQATDPEHLKRIDRKLGHAG